MLHNINSGAIGYLNRFNGKIQLNNISHIFGRFDQRRMHIVYTYDSDITRSVYKSRRSERL